jgi:ABC-type transport system substrate-binding protein
LQNKTLRTIGATVVLSGIAIAAMAQSGSGAKTQAEIESSLDAAPTSTTAPSPEVFEYRVGLLSGVSTANFWEYIGEQPTAWNAYVLGPTKPSLYGIDPATNTLSPDLAADEPVEPTWDEDGWKVRIELRDDRHWSNGEPVTAADIVYTFETVRRLGLEGGWTDAYPGAVEGMVAESDTSLTIMLNQRPRLDVWPYGLGLAPILSSQVWSPLTAPIESAADLYQLDGVGDVSGGPLQVVSLGEDEIRSVANPGYPGSVVDTVIYAVFPDEAAAASAVERGEIDSILAPNGLSGESVTRLESVPDVTISVSPANSVRYLGFNLTQEPMSEPAFRQAIALLLDVDSAATSLVPDASAAHSMLSPANKSWFDPTAASSLAQLYTGALSDRLARALTALEAAGYTWATSPSLDQGQLIAGTGLTIGGVAPGPLTILTPGDEYDPARSDYTRIIESTLEVLGFDVRPVVTDFDTVVDLAFSKDAAGVRQYDMYVLGWTLGNPLLPDFYRLLFASDGAVNSTGYANPDFDTQLAVYESASDVAEAKTVLWEMEKTLAEDLPYLALYHPVIIEAHRSDRIGFSYDSTLGGIQGRLGGIGDLTPAP